MLTIKIALGIIVLSILLVGVIVVILTEGDFDE